MVVVVGGGAIIGQNSVSDTSKCCKYVFFSSVKSAGFLVCVSEFVTDIGDVVTIAKQKEPVPNCCLRASYDEIEYDWLATV